MKNNLIIIAVAALAIVISICVGYSSRDKKETMEAVVTEIYESTMIVCPVEDSDSENAISIGLSDITDGSEPKIGDTYKIEYTGGIMESYPAQVVSTKVELMSKSQ